MSFSREEKMNAINFFLNEVLNKSYPIEERVGEMDRIGRKFCQGFPEWSDFWGNRLKPIDDISITELRELLSQYQE